MTLATLIEDVLGSDPPVRIETYDGSSLGPAEDEAPATIVIRSPNALRRIVGARGDLGFGRAYVSGDLDVRGDIFGALALQERLPTLNLRPGAIARLARHVLRELGVSALRPVPPPPEEARLHGRLHSLARDAAAISHHYDVSNEFYRRVLGPSLTYSCAVWADDDDTLEAAQARKYELICRKLDLRPSMRLLDVGCGWGGMAMHAAKHHGVEAVGVTISRRQAELAEKRVVEAGLAGRVTIRLQDEREVNDGPYDAISSIGMFEHVGEARLAEYFGHLHQLLRPGGRLLNHGISRPPGASRRRWSHRPKLGGFIDRYVFPDGELHEIGRVVSVAQEAGFEVRHVESIREHYARTLRSWVANLEANWETCVAEAGLARARVWRLYMAGSAVNFEANRTQVHQVLGVRSDGGGSGMPWRPGWEPIP